MTAAEYKRRRAALGHTQATLAKVLGLARGTIARRETGALPITPEAALALLACPKIKRGARITSPNTKVSHDGA